MCIRDRPLLAKIREVVTADMGKPAPAQALPSTALTDLISHITHRQPGQPFTGSDLSADLNLSSVDRVELMSALEDRYQVDLSEKRFSEAKTVGDLEQLLTAPSAPPQEFVYPRWAQRWPIRVWRFFIYYALTWPATMVLAAPRVGGRKRVRLTDGPFLVVCNHVTYLDAGFVLAALPFGLRHHLATAMDGERLGAMRQPSAELAFPRRVLERLKYFLVVSLFNIFPLPRRSGFRESFSYAGELIERGESVLIFPEGELTNDGTIAPFHGGIGLLASQLKVPVVPVRIDGLFAMRQAGKRMARPGTVRVTIGEAVKFPPEATPDEITQELRHRMMLIEPPRD